MSESTQRKVAAIIGGGVIGGGWAARFLLNGWDVKVYDPDPQAERKLSEVLANARRSLPGLYDEVLPVEGKMTLHTEIEEAVQGASWVQESVPERLDIKLAVYPKIQAALSEEAVLASSTSGFKPSELAEGALRPGQILVAHPYNPVYLLPLVEIVQHPDSDPAVIQSAMDIATSIGMKPVLIKKEIDAHIGDRLLEAVWRESLWLVKDDYATTEEIDDIIRYSFGLRWAQMGMFETYRIAGGEAGMGHFIAQFAPALQWPWTKLTDVPELDETLVNKIVEQSDNQSGQYGIRQLERQRDDNLVAILRAIKGRGWGAGKLLLEDDARLRGAEQSEAIDWSQPFVSAHRTVPVDWTDWNGHMNEARYLDVFSNACDKLLAALGCTPDYVEAGHSFFTVENIIQHIDEANAGDTVRVESQIIDAEGKRLHLFHRMLGEDGREIATGEQMLIHVSLETRRSAMPVEPVASMMTAAVEKQKHLARPDILKAGK
jgi:carnitine 3-dehydrogenase